MPYWIRILLEVSVSAIIHLTFSTTNNIFTPLHEGKHTDPNVGRPTCPTSSKGKQ